MIGQLQQRRLLQRVPAARGVQPPLRVHAAVGTLALLLPPQRAFVVVLVTLQRRNTVGSTTAAAKKAAAVAKSASKVDDDATKEETDVKRVESEGEEGREPTAAVST